MEPSVYVHIKRYEHFITKLFLHFVLRVQHPNRSFTPLAWSASPGLPDIVSRYGSKRNYTLQHLGRPNLLRRRWYRWFRPRHEILSASAWRAPQPTLSFHLDNHISKYNSHNTLRNKAKKYTLWIVKNEKLGENVSNYNIVMKWCGYTIANYDIFLMIQATISLCFLNLNCLYAKATSRNY